MSEKTEKSVLEQLQELEGRRKKLIEGAKVELVATAEAAVQELNELGFQYQLVEKGAKGSSKSGKQTRQRDPDKPCGVCGFATDPGHDGRAHKNKQEAGKFKPFTAKELETYGYTKKA